MSDATRESRSVAGSASEPGDPPRIAVVGAGVAGAAAAYALRDREVAVTVLERRDEPGGRTATQRRDGCVYDVGANYVKGDDETATRLVRRLDDGDLVDVDPPVWTFDAEGSVGPGDEERRDDHKWTFTGGLAALPRRLLDRSDAAVRTGTTVRGLVRAPDSTPDRWHLETAESGRLGPFDDVVLTPPGPVTASILDGSGDDRLERVATAARSVPYRTIESIALHYPFELDRPYYALVNFDRDHPVGWIAREDEKRGHVPDGESLLVVQLSPEWSAALADSESVRGSDRSPGTDAGASGGTIAEVAAHAASLLDDDRLLAPDWSDRRSWPHALPDAGAGADVRAGEPANVFVAGDWVRGEGRVHAALSSGLSVGRRLAVTLA